MHCFKFYICIGVMCVCVCVCVCVRARAYVFVCVCVRASAHVAASVWVGGVCGCSCTFEREGGRGGVSVGCVMICSDFSVSLFACFC